MQLQYMKNHLMVHSFGASLPVLSVHSNGKNYWSPERTPLSFQHSDWGFTVRTGCLSVVCVFLVINPSKVKWKSLKENMTLHNAILMQTLFKKVLYSFVLIWTKGFTAFNSPLYVLMNLGFVQGLLDVSPGLLLSKEVCN